MIPFADIVMEPGGIIAWLIVGLIAGWLTGLVMRGGGYGIILDLVLGLIGALIGGFIFGSLVTGSYGFVGSIVVAFLGAVILVAIVRFVTSGRTQL